MGSSRGGFDAVKMVDALVQKGINQLYCIGGDGTHRGINVLKQEIEKRNLAIALVGIPKTIDNDIPIIDKSFGYDTACEIAEKVIEGANAEANSAQNGVGLVKVMGRHAGWIALGATTASRDVNFCLIPEIPIYLYGENGFYESVIERLKHKNHAVIVVAEGCDDAIRDLDLGDRKKDASGNVLHEDVGKVLQAGIVKYGKEKHNMEVTLKYIDPTYYVRSVPANAGDTILCAKLAQNSVHGAMAGYTCFSVGMLRNTLVYIPIETLNEAGMRSVSRHDREWQRVLMNTGQRDFYGDDKKQEIEAEQNKKIKEQAALWKRLQDRNIIK